MLVCRFGLVIGGFIYCSLSASGFTNFLKEGTSCEINPPAMYKAACALTLPKLSIILNSPYNLKTWISIFACT